jgi:hypothetical protein
MLATTLSTQYVPGTNLKGQVVGANWLFLLPDLEIKQAICLGIPKTSSLKTLSRLSQKVIVYYTNMRGLKQIKSLGLKNITFESFIDLQKKSSTNDTDLIVLANKAIALNFFRNQTLQEFLRKLLKPEGYVYFEYHETRRKDYTARLIESFGKPHSFYLTPVIGEPYTAFPVGDDLSRHFFTSQGLDHPTIHLRGLSKLEKKLNHFIASSKISRRYGTLISLNNHAVEPGPPDYLQKIAEQSGMFLSNYRWFSVAGGGYSTRKLLFFLFKPDNNVPAFIVKMVRDPAFNYRLENEQRALAHLHSSGINDASRLPRVLFWGHHQNLAILGESYIEGKPFKQASRGTADCPTLLSGIEFLNNLAAETVDTSVASPKDVSKTLSKLLEQVIKIYNLPDQQVSFLEHQISALGKSQAQFPLVFQHGDPGIWNAVYSTQHQTVFLDWEASEIKGMPLWDLFYYLRSYITWVARNHGTRSQLQGMKQFLLEDNSISRFWIDATNQYCQRIGLSKELVEPLFYTCWMHRALKEATRLTSSRVNRGSYINLLNFFIEHHSSPTLTLLFSASKTSYQNVLIQEGLEQAL